MKTSCYGIVFCFASSLQSRIEILLSFDVGEVIPQIQKIVVEVKVLVEKGSWKSPRRC